MKKYLVQVKNNPLITGSVVIFVGSNAANVFNFLSNLFISRNVSSVDLGVLVSLTSIITLITVPASSLVPTIVNFAATFFAQGDLGKLKGLFYQFGKLLFFVGLVFFLLSLVLSTQIAGFLKIPDSRYIVVAGLMVFVTYLSTINTAFLQAKLSFLFISSISFVGSFLKFIFSVLVILSGFGIYGALWGFLFAFLIAYVLSFLQLRFVTDRSISLSHSKLHDLLLYGVPATVALFSLTAFTSVDIILVKHFFTPEEAGNYAVLSVVAKIIYFLTAPISSVMFPIIVQKYTQGEKYHNIFLVSLLLVLIPSVLLTIGYFFFPAIIMKIIVNKHYYEHLGLFGVYISGYALLQVLANFYLSIKKTIIWLPILFAAVFQALLITFFHQSILQVIIDSLVVVFVLLFGLLLYYPYATKR